jgi:hypothetical protein
MLRELGEAWKDAFPGGVPSNDVGLDAMHYFTIDWLCEKIKIPGLKEYLRAIEHVRDEDDVSVQQSPS